MRGSETSGASLLWGGPGVGENGVGRPCERTKPTVVV